MDPVKGTDYLKLAKEMGANCVRTWGENQGTQQYFDAAQRLGLKVNAGIWLNYPDGRVSYLDIPYKLERKKEILDYVRRFKNHPAILFWNVGNEVFAFTKAEEQRVAFAQYLEELCEEIKKEDPNHRVIYASADQKGFRYIADHVPSLDIIGVNAYNNLPMIHQKWEAAGLGIPYVFTEFGPPGYWESVKDENGKAMEISDGRKAKYYSKAIKDMNRHSKQCLGGFAFHLGRSPQTSLTWFALNYEGDRMAGFWAVRQGLTGEFPVNRPPVIETFSISGKRNLSKKERGNLVVEAYDSERDRLAFFFRLGTAIEDGVFANKEWDLAVKKTGHNQYSFEAPEESGIYRVYLMVRDGHGNIASANKTIKVE